MTNKEAKETLKTMKENIDKKYLKTRNSLAIETVLNLIQTQQAEIEKKDKQIEQYQNMLATNDMLHVLECEKKDKIIDEMARKMLIYQIKDSKLTEKICSECGYEDCCEDISQDCIKQYYERKVKDGN